MVCAYLLFSVFLGVKDACVKNEGLAQEDFLLFEVSHHAIFTEFTGLADLHLEMISI